MRVFVAVVAIAGGTAYAASQRTRDLGIRIALGARTIDGTWALAGAQRFGFDSTYSCRNVRMGSTFAARAAGIHAADRHAATITKDS